MENDRRKDKRSALESTLILKRLDSDSKSEVVIDIIDVSKGGIGFSCKEPLVIGAVYESYLTIWTKEILHAFLQIARIEMKGEAFIYGASFVGMPEIDQKRIEVYQTVNENE